MDNSCLSLLLKQILCENGLRKVKNNGCINVTESTTIELECGYTLTATNNNNESINVTISHPYYIPDITFNIREDCCKSIDLPVMNGTYTLCIGVKRMPCCQQSVCCT